MGGEGVGDGCPSRNDRRRRGQGEGDRGAVGEDGCCFGDGKGNHAVAADVGDVGEDGATPQASGHGHKDQNLTEGGDRKGADSPIWGGRDAAAGGWEGAGKDDAGVQDIGDDHPGRRSTACVGVEDGVGQRGARHGRVGIVSFDHVQNRRGDGGGDLDRPGGRAVPGDRCRVGEDCAVRQCGGDGHGKHNLPAGRFREGADLPVGGIRQAAGRFGIGGLVDDGWVQRVGEDNAGDRLGSGISVGQGVDQKAARRDRVDVLRFGEVQGDLLKGRTGAGAGGEGQRQADDAQQAQQEGKHSPYPLPRPVGPPPRWG